MNSFDVWLIKGFTVFKPQIKGIVLVFDVHSEKLLDFKNFGLQKGLLFK